MDRAPKRQGTQEVCSLVEKVPDSWTQTVEVFERVMRIVWQRLSPTFGIRTINAIAKNVIVRQSQDYPFVQQLRVGEDGLDWTEVKAHAGDVQEEELIKTLETLVDEFFDALSSLIGKLIVGKLFQEAEELTKKEGTQ